MQKWLIGVDEAGRGPLAGPVSVGVVLIPYDFNWDLIPGVNDSKKLSAKKREVIFARTLELVKMEKLWYSVHMPSAKMIDTKGIAVVIRASLAKGLVDVMAEPRRSVSAKNEQGSALLKSSRKGLEPGEVMVKLDGSLYAPAEFIHQETIIKGDAKERVIGLASIMAKVTRDRYMEKLAKKSTFQAYDFARHKGYGTLAHRTAITANGLSTEHRVTYCRNIILVV